DAPVVGGGGGEGLQGGLAGGAALDVPGVRGVAVEQATQAVGVRAGAHHSPPSSAATSSRSILCTRCVVRHGPPLHAPPLYPPPPGGGKKSGAPCKVAASWPGELIPGARAGQPRSRRRPPGWGGTPPTTPTQEMTHVSSLRECQTRAGCRR